MIQFIWDRNVKITAADIPELTEEIVFGDGFDRQIGPNILPATIKSIVFGCGYDRPIGRNVLPSSLESIVFGDDFNQPIAENVLPENLKYIKFGWDFNQPIGPNVLPGSLKDISFEWGFNQTIGPNVLPRYLESINFGHCFNQPIGPNVLPESLESIMFGDHFDQPIDHNVLPEYLKTIRYGHNYNHPISGLYHLTHLEHISIFSKNTIEINVERLPLSLKYFCISNIDTLMSLNSESQRMWFSVTYRDIQVLLDITYPIFAWPLDSHDNGYEVIGNEFINGDWYDKLINPKTYQPRSNAKSARK